jgi:hypothetical protein
MNATISTTPAIPGPQKIAAILASLRRSETSQSSTLADTVKIRPHRGGVRGGMGM